MVPGRGSLSGGRSSWAESGQETLREAGSRAMRNKREVLSTPQQSRGGVCLKMHDLRNLQDEDGTPGALLEVNFTLLHFAYAGPFRHGGCTLHPAAASQQLFHAVLVNIKNKE